MDVQPGLEGAFQLGDVADMGQKAQFDLAVVGADQQMAGGGDEGLADFAAGLGAYGYVLEVGIAGGQTAGRGGGQLIGGVDAVGPGVGGGDQASV